NLSSLKGKTIFVNLWATWCGPCVGEMPSIENLYHQFADRDDVAFVLISLDQSISAPTRFAKTKGMQAPIFFAKSPPPRGFQSDGMPLPMIIRKDGTLGPRHMGGRDWSGAGGLINDIAKASATKESK